MCQLPQREEKDWESLYHFLTVAVQLLFLPSRGQMISAEDCEFIQRFEMKRSPEEKQEMLQTEGTQVIDINICHEHLPVSLKTLEKIFNGYVIFPCRYAS